MRGQTVLTATVEKADDGDVEITELEKFEPTRVDGVRTPANGFPILMMKGIGEQLAPAGSAAGEGKQSSQKQRPVGVLSKKARRGALEAARGLLADPSTAVVLAKDAPSYDESADIAGALATIKQIATLIVSEATQLGNGRLEEAYDIGTLMDAICAMKCFLWSERDQDGGPAGPGGAAAADDMNGSVSYKALDGEEPDGDLEKSEYEELVKAKYSADDKQKMLAAGHAIPNEKGEPSYPIGDAQDVKRAVRAVGRGKVPHGKIRAHIKRNAKRVGAANLIPDSWKGGKTAAKGAMLTESQPHESGAAITPDVIKAAVAEAVKPAEERIKALADELAKVKAMPIPGGPHLVTSQTQRPALQPGIQKAERLRAIAAQTSDPETRRSYLELAAREEGAPITKD